VKAEAFDELLTSVRQAGEIRRGTRRASRTTKFRPADVQAIRAKLGASQTEFALMIGVSVATLRNWEQGRRRPEGPALALLRVAARNPQAVVDALHAEPKSEERHNKAMDLTPGGPLARPTRRRSSPTLGRQDIEVCEIRAQIGFVRGPIGFVGRLEDIRNAERYADMTAERMNDA
jgi:putative transcriptional regulator